MSRTGTGAALVGAAFDFGLSLEDQNAEMRCMVESGVVNEWLGH